MITTLGQISLCFVVIFTIWAAMKTSIHGGQSMKASIVEAWVNILIGFIINFTANMVIWPMDGHDISPNSAFWIGCIYTAISIFRSFLIRRFFNFQTVAKVK